LPLVLVFALLQTPLLLKHRAEEKPPAQ